MGEKGRLETTAEYGAASDGPPAQVAPLTLRVAPRSGGQGRTGSTKPTRPQRCPLTKMCAERLQKKNW